jgi:hypothetical protein
MKLQCMFHGGMLLAGTCAALQAPAGGVTQAGSYFQLF